MSCFMLFSELTMLLYAYFLEQAGQEAENTVEQIGNSVYSREDS